MKILNEGYSYEAQNLGDYTSSQEIKFPRFDLIDDELKMIEDGTTNEELLSILINRLQFLQSKAPCRENAIVITKLEESLMWLEKRQKDRAERGVLGTPKP